MRESTILDDRLGDQRLARLATDLLWIGSVSSTAFHGSWTQLFISVNEQGDQNVARRTKQYPVAFLSLLRPRYFARHDIDDDVLCIEIETRTVRVTKAGKSVGTESGDEFLLPFECFNAHQNNTESNVIMAQSTEGSVIIPCAELVRFYFANNGSLAKRLVRPVLDWNELWTDIQGPDERGHVHITLAEHVSGLCAPHIARIALDRQAQRAARMISNSLLEGQNGGQPAYLKTIFPFSGKTTLKVRAVEFTHGHLGKRVVVEEILQCSHPFPFKSLTYSAVTNSRSRSKRTEQLSQPGSKPSTQATATKLDKEVDVAENEPKRETERKQLIEHVDSPFPDLKNKFIRRVTPPADSSVQIVAGRVVSEIATGDGSNSSTTAAGDLGFGDRAVLRTVKLPLHCPIAAFEPFIRLVESLVRDAEHLTVYGLPLNDRQVYPHYCELPCIVDEDGEVAMEARISISIDQFKRNTRGRYFSALVVSSKHWDTLIIAVEQEPGRDGLKMQYRDLIRDLPTREQLIELGVALINGPLGYLDSLCPTYFDGHITSEEYQLALASL